MKSKAPWWVNLIIILMMVPLTATPELLGRCPSEPSAARMLVWGYPFYLLIAGWLAWVSWQSRPYMTWLLVALMALSTVGVWMLVSLPLTAP